MKSFVAMSLTLAVLFTAACGEPKQPAPENQPVQKEEKKAYLPVSDYLQSEIKKVDSAVTGILKRVTRNGRKQDSVFITPQQFQILAQDFLSPELSAERFEKAFRENSFFDETTNSLTFTYEAADASVSVRRVDVLVAPSLQFDEVKSIYIEKSYASGDTAVSKKMMWKAGSDLSIITIKTLAGRKPDLEQVNVTWDPLKY